MGESEKASLARAHTHTQYTTPTPTCTPHQTHYTHPLPPPHYTHTTHTHITHTLPPPHLPPTHTTHVFVHYFTITCGHFIAGKGCWARSMHGLPSSSHALGGTPVQHKGEGKLPRKCGCYLENHQLRAAGGKAVREKHFL